MTLIDDIAAYLVTNSIGTAVGTDVFKSYLPDTDSGTVIGVFDTGGTKPDVDLISLKKPTFQVFIRANNYSTGKAKLDSVRSLLHGVIETTIGSTYVLYMHALAEGGHVGRSEDGQEEFSINFTAETR